MGHRGFRRHFSPSRLCLVSAGALCVLAVLFQVRALWWSDASCWPLQQKWAHVGTVRSPSGPLEVWTPRDPGWEPGCCSCLASSWWWCGCFSQRRFWLWCHSEHPWEWHRLNFNTAHCPWSSQSGGSSESQMATSQGFGTVAPGASSLLVWVCLVHLRGSAAPWPSPARCQ